MFKFSIVAILIAFSGAAMAYDSTWYKADFWSGEYPPGFQVYKKGIVVLGRKNLDDTEAPSVRCVLKRNKYAPGKSLPKAEYVEMTKIAPMIAKQDFTYKSYVYNEQTQTSDELNIEIKKGDTVEFLTYYAEGAFRARYKGQEFDADQDLFENMVATAEGEYFTTPSETHNWINLSCVNKVNVWLKLDDLFAKNEEGWIDGVRGFFYNPYR